jgi:Ino eighty subunit 1
LENVDSEEEKTLAEKLIAQRNHIAKTQAAKETNKETIGEDDEIIRSPDDEDKLKVNRRGKTREFDWGTRTAAAKERKAAADKRRRERIKQKAKDEEAVSHLEKLKPSDGDCDAVAPTCKS